MREGALVLVGDAVHTVAIEFLIGKVRIEGKDEKGRSLATNQKDFKIVGSLLCFFDELVDSMIYHTSGIAMFEPDDAGGFHEALEVIFEKTCRAALDADVFVDAKAVLVLDIRKRYDCLLDRSDLSVLRKVFEVHVLGERLELSIPFGSAS